MGREINNLGEVLYHSKLLTKQTCNISGMGMTKPLGVMGIEVTTYHDISIGLKNVEEPNENTLETRFHPQEQSLEQSEDCS